MFLFMLGGSLALGAGLFAVASFSEGTLLATRTVAQVIGWLFIVATFAGAAVLRRVDFGSMTAVSVTLGSGLLLVYMAHFDWSEIRPMATAYAAIEDLRVIETPSPKLAAALGMKEIVIPDMPRAQPHTPFFAAAPKDFSVAFLTVEALQRSRCSEKLGIAWLVCHESTRLEYCEGRPSDQANCPSPIPLSYPG